LKNIADKQTNGANNKRIVGNLFVGVFST